jgi:DNA-binding FrmR family transcriptional regulator
MPTEVFTIGPHRASKKTPSPLGVQIFDEVLMKFLRRKEALLVRPSRARPSTGASNERGAVEPIRRCRQKVRGYIKAKDKQLLHNRLRRIEGQVRGLQRMVAEEAYCVEVLTQIASIVSASEKVALIVLEDHVEHCLREAIEDGEETEVKAAELAAAVERFLRI